MEMDNFNSINAYDFNSLVFFFIYTDNFKKVFCLINSLNYRDQKQEHYLQKKLN